MKKGLIRAQSTLEYLLILSAIVVLIIYAAGKMIKPAVEKSLDNAQAGINATADKLDTLQ